MKLCVDLFRQRQTDVNMLGDGTRAGGHLSNLRDQAAVLSRGRQGKRSVGRFPIQSGQRLPTTPQLPAHPWSACL